MREFVVAKRREKVKTERDLWMCWQTANLTRADRLPEFKTLVRQALREPLQTEEERAAMWHHIGQTMGKVRKHRKRRVRIIRGHGK